MKRTLWNITLASVVTLVSYLALHAIWGALLSGLNVPALRLLIIAWMTTVAFGFFLLCISKIRKGIGEDEVVSDYKDGTHHSFTEDLRLILKRDFRTFLCIASIVFSCFFLNLNHKLLELIVERRAVVVSAPRSPRPGASAYDRVFTLRKYKFDLTASVDENQKYVILNPAPISVSKVDGAALTVLYDNDALIPGVKVCGLKWFIENVFDGEGQI